MSTAVHWTKGSDMFTTLDMQHESVCDIYLVISSIYRFSTVQLMDVFTPESIIDRT